jgi:hypothetical protein
MEDIVDIGQIGGAIATVATVIAAIYGALDYHRPKQRAAGMSDTVAQPVIDTRPIIVMGALVLIAWGAVLFDYYTRDSPQSSESLIEAWTGQPPVYNMVVNTKDLVKYKSSSKLMMLARVNFADRDATTDTVIETSGLYTITGERINIAHPSSSLLRFAALQPNQVQLYLLLIPNNVTPDSIKTLNDVERVGGKSSPPDRRS